MEDRSRPLSAYLHIPFCEKKCIYCDFYSIENLSQRASFVDLLTTEIALKVAAYPALQDRELSTIFFGGGTPSLLEPEELERIIVALKQHFRVAKDCEFTLECNPGTVDLKKLSGYHALGVNRLSFGVQSFNQAELEFLGRIHDGQQAREAVHVARQAGFDNVSLDLIFALPDQSAETLRSTLNEALALETDHISAYNLIVEPGTPLFRLVQLDKVIELDPDRSAELFDLTQETLYQAGYHQYEVSNYARSEEKRAKHNLVYWDGFKEYVSFGPSAHEFLGNERAWNVSSLDQYRQAIEQGKLPRINSEFPSQEERMLEVLYVQLRSVGARVEEYKQQFGLDLREHSEAKHFIKDGLLEEKDGLLRLTKNGYRFCDGIVTTLLSHEAAPSYRIA